MSSTTKLEGERERIRMAIVRLRSHLVSLEIAMKCPGRLGLEAGQGITEAAMDLAVRLARLDLMMEEQDG